MGRRGDVGVWGMEGVPRPQARACVFTLGEADSEVCSFCGAPGPPLRSADAQAAGQAKGPPPPTPSLAEFSRGATALSLSRQSWAHEGCGAASLERSPHIPQPRASAMRGHGLARDGLTDDGRWAQAARLPEG